jgi:hypothetical protein
VATQIVPASLRAEHTPTEPLSLVAAEAVRRLELALTTPDLAVVEKVRVFLGYQRGWKPDPYFGESLTVNVPDVGPVEVVTDIEDDPEHGYRTDIPVVVAARLHNAVNEAEAVVA